MAFAGFAKGRPPNVGDARAISRAAGMLKCYESRGPGSLMDEMMTKNDDSSAEALFDKALDIAER
jgi:hypothetical protein